MAWHLEPPKCDFGHDAVRQREGFGWACVGQQKPELGRPEPCRDVGAADRALHSDRHFVEHASRHLCTVLGDEVSELVDREDTTRERIQVTLRLLELDREALVKKAMVRERAKLLMEGRVSEFVLGKLHVVMGSLHPQHVLDAREKLRVLERFRDVVVRAGSKPLNARALIVGRGKKDDRNEAILGDGLDDPARIDTAQAGHVDVEDNQVDWLGANRVDGLLPVAGLDDNQSPCAEELGYMLTRRTIVVGDNHYRLRKWTGSPHSDTITERGEIREPGPSSFPESPSRLYSQSTRFRGRGA